MAKRRRKPTVAVGISATFVAPPTRVPFEEGNPRAGELERAPYVRGGLNRRYYPEGYGPNQWGPILSYDDQGEKRGEEAERLLDPGIYKDASKSFPWSK